MELQTLNSYIMDIICDQWAYRWVILSWLDINSFRINKEAKFVFLKNKIIEFNG